MTDLQPSTDLDVIIAETVFGWRVLPGVADREDIDWLDNQANYPYLSRHQSGLILWVAPQTDGKWWSPSSDMSVAWSIIEHFANRPPYGNFSQFWDGGVFARRRDLYGAGQLVWTASLQVPQKWGERVSVSEDAATSEMAICAVALKAIKKFKEKS